MSDIILIRAIRCGGARANDGVENEESDGSDVEENKIFKELTSEIDEIISL